MIARDHGADIIYSSGNTLSRFEAMANVGINCGGHVGLVPARASREGGLKAKGKTLDEAVRIYEDTLAYQNAGAVIVEMEVVAADIATEISKRVDILVMSLGSGPGCDGQFLFSADLLGIHEPRYPGMGKPYQGPLPRHAEALHRHLRRGEDRVRRVQGRSHQRRIPDRRSHRPSRPFCGRSIPLGGRRPRLGPIRRRSVTEDGSCTVPSSEHPDRDRARARRLHPRHRGRRRRGGPRRDGRHALPARAERLPPHRPREGDLPQFRRRRASSAAAATSASTTRIRRRRSRSTSTRSRRTSAGSASTGASTSTTRPTTSSSSTTGPLT